MAFRPDVPPRTPPQEQGPERVERFQRNANEQRSAPSRPEERPAPEQDAIGGLIDPQELKSRPDAIPTGDYIRFSVGELTIVGQFQEMSPDGTMSAKIFTAADDDPRAMGVWSEMPEGIDLNTITSKIEHGPFPSGE